MEVGSGRTLKNILRFDPKHIISIELTESLTTFDLLLPIVPNHNRCTDDCNIS